MSEVVVTRNHQITLTKAVRSKLGIREGDRVVINVAGDVAIVAKRDPEVWRSTGSFLPEGFDEILEEVRGDPEDRLDRLGLV